MLTNIRRRLRSIAGRTVFALALLAEFARAGVLTLRDRWFPRGRE